MFFIAVEGIDGSGKGTQVERLYLALKTRYKHVTQRAFPQYEQNYFGARVRDYLDGKYGSLAQNHPFLVSLLYGFDRWQTLSELTAAGPHPQLEEEIFVFDRYVPSNMCHQGAKCQAQLKYELATEIEHVEYDILGLPRPNLVIVLDIDVSKALERLATRQKRGAQDIHEADKMYLEEVRQLYRHYAAERDNWVLIDADKEELLVASRVIEVAGNALRDHHAAAGTSD